MGSKGISAGFALIGLLVASLSLIPSQALALEGAPPQTAVIENLIAAKRYDDADSKALLILEQALQQNSLPTQNILDLGKVMQKASRFEVSKAIFNAALAQYTLQGELGNMAISLLYLATAERQLSNYTSATSYIRRAMSIAQIERNSALKAQLNLELGIIQQEQGEVEAALEPLKEALQYFREANDTTQTSVCLLRIGDIYSLLNQASMAQTYYQDAYDTANQGLQDKRILGITKTRIGALQLKSGLSNDAVNSIASGLDLLLAVNDVGAIAEAKIVMGQALVEVGDIAKGRGLLQEAMSFADSSGQAKLVKEGRLALAQAYLKEQNFENALIHARTGTVTARKSKDLRGQLSFLSLQLSAYVSMGEFKKALDIQSVIQQLREALLDSQNKTAIEGLQAEIELVRQSRTLEKLTESKQLALAQAERENLRTTLIWSISLAGL
ncbi:MAG: tetratricopeptide repeat protein [Pseudomonadota bacterium]|nr:tetratricopeptide repeat protein [Pseudomonadota bacterium]